MRDAELAAGSLFCASPLSQQRRDMLEGRSTPSPLWPGTSPHVSVNYCWVTNHPKLSLWASSQGLAGSWWRASHGGGCLGSQWLRSSCSGSLSATLSLSVLHTWGQEDPSFCSRPEMLQAPEREPWTTSGSLLPGTQSRCSWSHGPNFPPTPGHMILLEDVQPRTLHPVHHIACHMAAW